MIDMAIETETIKDKYGFYALLALSFLLVFICNLLTPYLSDDFFYGKAARDAESFADLIGQEYHQYMTWNGRSIVHFMLRVSFRLPDILFKFVNSLVYVLLSLLVYINVDKRKRFDIPLIAGITLMLWFGLVSFSETVLWRTGAINYMWGTVIILGFVTCYRSFVQAASRQSPVSAAREIILALCLFVFGIAAGWCNENTSGGGLLLTLGAFACHMLQGKKEPHPVRKVRPFMISGLAGQIIGLVIMVISPGAKNRASLQEPESFSGIIGLFARFQKITLVLQESLFIWIAIYLLLLVMVVYKERRKNSAATGEILIKLRRPVGFFLTSAATSYALIFTAPTRERAHFGAAIFLFMGIANLYCELKDDEYMIAALKRAFLFIGAAWFFFFYMDNVTNLGRLYREENERYEYIADQAVSGNTEYLVVPKLRPDFETALSDAYLVDLSDDPGYWINVYYENYFGIDEITAIPRDEWEEEYGD